MKTKTIDRPVQMYSHLTMVLANMLGGVNLVPTW
jgi:hypothetical protein